jgi:glycosyltransferase involved in cell wall biosynthesis
VPALDGGFTVVFAGNVGAAQGVNIIVEAATRLQAYSEIRFVVIGSGSRWEWMRDEIARRGLHNLHLVGRFPLETMPALMQKASVLLVCLADRDIFTVTVPSKVQAYLGSGRPIIASLNGEGARIVREARAGIAVPAEDADALTAAVLELYRMPDVQRAAMGQNGRRYCKDNFDHGMLASRLVDYLQSAMEHGKDRM